jgi:hypothetical protein
MYFVFKEQNFFMLHFVFFRIKTTDIEISTLDSNSPWKITSDYVFLHNAWITYKRLHTTY